MASARNSLYFDAPDFYEMPSEHPELNSSEAGPITADEDFDKSEFIREAGGFDSPRKTSSSSQSDKKKNDEEKKVAVKARDSSPGKYATFTRAKHSLSSTPSPRQELLAREISKLQDLMMKHEESYEEAIQSRSEEVETLRKRLAELETGGGGAGQKLSKAQAEVNKLRKDLEESLVTKKQLIMIMEEYEKTIAQVVAKREQEKKEFESVKEAIAGERDTALSHLSNMEIAFNDIHQKYERCKSVIDSFRRNEEAYKASLKENERTIRQQEDNYLRLKAHASEKLEQASIELDRLQHSHVSEIARMSAMNRKTEIKLKSLEEGLDQKNREVIELTKICDELISRVETK